MPGKTIKVNTDEYLRLMDVDKEVSTLRQKLKCMQRELDIQVKRNWYMKNRLDAVNRAATDYTREFNPSGYRVKPTYPKRLKWPNE